MDFLKKAKEKLGNNYSFNKTNFLDWNINVIITCKEHGDFLAEPINIIYHNTGCPLCASKKISEKKKLSTEEFIKRANLVHNNKYEYSLVDYKDSRTKINIICKEHGLFSQTPTNHLSGHGCPKCALLRRQQKKYEN